MNKDLNRAQQLLEQGLFTCVLCKDDVTRTCTARGIRPLLELVDEGNWSNFSAADKVVGKATAFLYVLLGVKAVYASVISEEAARILTLNHIDIQFGVKVPAIFNRDRSGFCPMEAATWEIEDPQAALIAIRKTYVQLVSHG